MSTYSNNVSRSRIFYENEFNSEPNPKDNFNEKSQMDPSFSLSENIELENESMTKKDIDIFHEDNINQNMSQHSNLKNRVSNLDKLNISNYPIHSQSMIVKNSNNLFKLSHSHDLMHQTNNTDMQIRKNEENKSNISQKLNNKLVEAVQLIENKSQSNLFDKFNNKTSSENKVEVILIQEKIRNGNNNSNDKSDSENLYQIENSKVLLNENSKHDAASIVSKNSKKSENSSLKDSLKKSLSKDLNEEIRFKNLKKNSFDEKDLRNSQLISEKVETIHMPQIKEIPEIKNIPNGQPANIEQIQSVEKNAFRLFMSTVQSERMANLEKKILYNNRSIFNIKLILKSPRTNKNDFKEYIPHLLFNYKDKEFSVPLKNFDASISFELTQVETDLGINLKSVCEYLSNLYNYIENFEKSFKNILLPLDLNLYLLFLILNKNEKKWRGIKDLNILELKLKEALNKMKIEEAVSEIRRFVDFTKKNLCLDELENLRNIDDDLDKINYTNLYNDIISIRERFNKYFHSNSKVHANSEIHIKNKLCLFLKKIKNYFINFFPFCCGRNKLNKFREESKKSKQFNDKTNWNEINKNEILNLFFCLKCRLLICTKCLKFHKNHKKFNFTNFKSEKIQSDCFIQLIFEELIWSIEKENKIENLLEENSQSKNEKGLWPFIEISLYEFLFKNFVKLSKSQNFLETKKKFLNDKNLGKSIFIALNKHKYSSVLNEDISSKLYKTVIKKYSKLIFIEKFNKKPNEILIEELFMNNLSLEMNVNKSILISNNELNYDQKSDDFTFMISQKNSYFNFYYENFLSKNGKKSENKKFSQNLENSSKNYFQNQTKFSTDLNMLNIEEGKEKFLVNEVKSRKVSYPNVKEDSNNSKLEKLPDSFTPENEDDKTLTVFNKIIEIIENDKNTNNCFNRIPGNEEKNSHNKIFRNYTSNDDYKNGDFMDEFCSTLEVINFFLEDFLNKLKSFGIPLIEN